ncbi:MAG: hypothetical protein R3A45_13535, partial [Bdellovibrionota bacterium]
MTKMIYKLSLLLLVVGLGACQKETIEKKISETTPQDKITERGGVDISFETTIFVTEQPVSQLCRVQRGNTSNSPYDLLNQITVFGGGTPIENITGIDMIGANSFYITTGFAGNPQAYQNQLLTINVDWNANTANVVAVVAPLNGFEMSDITLIDSPNFGLQPGLIGLDKNAQNLIYLESGPGGIFNPPMVFPIQNLPPTVLPSGLALFKDDCNDYQILVSVADNNGTLTIYSIDPFIFKATPMPNWGSTSNDYINAHVAIGYNGWELQYGHHIDGDPNRFGFSEDGNDLRCLLNVPCLTNPFDFQIPSNGMNAVE